MKSWMKMKFPAKKDEKLDGNKSFNQRPAKKNEKLAKVKRGNFPVKKYEKLDDNGFLKPNTWENGQ